jgi:hypothetical protein
MSQISGKWQPPCLAGNLKWIRYKRALTPALVKFHQKSHIFIFLLVLNSVKPKIISWFRSPLRMLNLSSSTVDKFHKSHNRSYLKIHPVVVKNGRLRPFSNANIYIYMSIKNSNRYHYHINKIKLSGVDYSINKGFYIIKLPKSYVCSWYKTTEWNSNFRVSGCCW